MVGGERGSHQRVCLDGDVFQPEVKGADERREQQAKCCCGFSDCHSSAPNSWLMNLRENSEVCLLPTALPSD